MAFHVTSSTPAEVHHDRPVESESSSVLAKACRQAALLSRRFMGAYAGFSLQQLDHTMRVFSMRNGEALDIDAFYSGILAHARHRLQGRQAAVEQDLIRLKALLEEGEQRAHASAAEDGVGGGVPTDAAGRARREQEHHNARHYQRTYAQAGRTNALALLGGQGAPAAPYVGHPQASQPTLTEILDALARQRQRDGDGAAADPLHPSEQS
uniref:Uncharacterized protein n=1 Tax=Herbaspirillum rubrisubalbicans M1 TaxID=1078773 RepID=H2CYJ9_9BURK|nr:hypothetical protein [Herbaspirillum rubrisubalbicans M1]